MCAPFAAALPSRPLRTHPRVVVAVVLQAPVIGIQLEALAAWNGVRIGRRRASVCHWVGGRHEERTGVAVADRNRQGQCVAALHLAELPTHTPHGQLGC